ALAEALHLLLDALHVALELARHLRPDLAGLVRQGGEPVAHLLQPRHVAGLGRAGARAPAMHFLRSLCRHLGPFGRAAMGRMGSRGGPLRPREIVQAARPKARRVSVNVQLRGELISRQKGPERPKKGRGGAEFEPFAFRPGYPYLSLKPPAGWPENAWRT